MTFMRKSKAFIKQFINILPEYFLMSKNIDPADPTGEPVIRPSQRDETLIADRFYNYHIRA